MEYQGPHVLQQSWEHFVVILDPKTDSDVSKRGLLVPGQSLEETGHWGGGQAPVQVGVLAVPIPAADRREHGATARNLAAEQLAEMDSLVVGPESALIAVHLPAQVARYGQAWVGLGYKCAQRGAILCRDPLTVSITVLHECRTFLTHSIRIPR